MHADTSWTAPHIVSPSNASAQDLELFASLPVSIVDQIPADSWQLSRIDDQLSLTREDGVSLSIDFVQGKARHRTTESGFGAQTLSKALGIHTYRRQFNKLPSIVDANGGMGQDAWAIASIGCTVTIIEKHPVLHAMLADGLQRALNDENTREIASRVTLVHGDSITQLHQLSTTAQIVYLDPMYPVRGRRKAESKKSAQFLQALSGPAVAEESAALLKSALQLQLFRVVVKRPARAPELDGSHEFAGQITTHNSTNTRYDIYHQ